MVIQQKLIKRKNTQKAFPFVCCAENPLNQAEKHNFFFFAAVIGKFFKQAKKTGLQI